MKIRETTGIVFLCCVMALALFACGKDRAESEAPPAQEEEAELFPKTADEPEDDDGEYWKKSFVFMRDQILTEPSPHFLKHPEGVFWGRQGNSLEKAFALAEELRLSGEKVRIAKGELDEPHAVRLVFAAFREEGEFSYGPDVPVFDPGQDRDLLDSVRSHYWVQIDRDGAWVDLDPSFPEAEIGRAFAVPDKTFDVLPENMIPGVEISLVVDSGVFSGDEAMRPSSETVLEWKGTLETVACGPLSLVVTANFQPPAGTKKTSSRKEEEQERGAAGMWGGLAGSKPAKPDAEAKAEGIMATYSARLSLGEEVLSSGSFSEIVETSGQKSREKILNVRLDFRVTSAGRDILSATRILFDKAGPIDVLPPFQRHAVLVTPNNVPDRVWEEELMRVSDEAFLSEVKTGVEKIRKNLDRKDISQSLLDDSLSLEARLGPALGHVVNMIFASTSDRISQDLGRALGILPYYSTPRIIITSFEGTEDRVDVSLDLRRDFLDGIPYPRQALGMRETFLYGRGVIESILEGKVLELLTGKQALTTAFLMSEAASRDIPIGMFSMLEKNELEEIDLPPRTRQKIEESLEKGDIVVLPVEGIEYDGEIRWGWWRIDPYGGDMVGVLDTGLHQAMISRTILETKGPLDKRMGFVIGAITGAVDTQWMLAAMVLKHGALTDEALEEAKEYMKNIKTYLCPEFGEKKSVTFVSGTVVNIEDCYKKEYSVGLSAGVEIKMGWCQNFAKGFACASTSILNSHLGR